ncbi:UNVERIFIED_CONTAM: hypothetical protein HHA_213300 [Hammondia hammondi]|eukprot:XP_008883999.1 hypothetical protein HHA_213300 [Hammondia hammondi]
MHMQPEEREDPSAHDQGWDLARQLAAVSASVDSLRRRAEKRVTENELKKETLEPLVPPLLIQRLRSLLHSDGLLPPLSESAGVADGSRSRAQASQKERNLEKFITGYCSLSPLCSEVLTLLQLLLFKETGVSFGNEDSKQRGAPRQADGDSRLEKKLQRDLEELSELLLSFLCSIFEQDSLDTADFRTCHTRRKVSAAVTAQAFLSSVGLFLSSSPSASSSLLSPSPLLRLRCLQLLRAAVAVPHSPAAFSVAAALGAHASSGAETERGDRLLFAGLVVALEGPQSKLRQTKKQPGNARGGGLWPPPLACNAAPEETLPLSTHKVSMHQESAGENVRDSASVGTSKRLAANTPESAGAWPVAWGRSFTACSCLSRGCGRRNASAISRLLAAEPGCCRHLTGSVLGSEESRASSPTEVAAAVRRLTSETVGSGEDTPGATCGAVPIRYALRQEALCLLLILLLHRDKSVGLALLQRPPPRVQALPSPLSGSPSSTSSPAAPRPTSVVDLLINAFLPLRFDRRQDALVWLLGFRRALLDLETRARVSAAFRASAGGRRGGRERSHFSEVFSKGAKGGHGEEDGFRSAVEEPGTRGEGPSGPGGANPVGWVWRRLATGPVLHALAHLLHAFTSRENLEQLLGPLSRQIEEMARHAEVEEDGGCTGSQGGEVPQRTEGGPEGTQSWGSIECGSDVRASGQKTGMSLGADTGLYVGLLHPLFLSSDASCSSPSWLLQRLLRDFIFFAFPTSALSPAPLASSPRSAHSPPSPQASLVLSFLHALRPVFLPPQQELLLSLLASYPLELHTRFLETFSALHLAARSSVQFALSHFLLFRLLLLPLNRLRASPTLLDSLLPPLPPSSPIFSPPPDGASCLAAAPGAGDAPLAAAETRLAAETLEAAAKVQLQEVAVAEQRRQLIQPLLSLMSPPGLQLRHHLTASLLHSSLSVNFFGFVLLRVACRLFQTVGEALVQATQAHEAGWGRAGRGALSRLLKTAMRERLPDEKTVLNCLKKLEQRFRVFQEEATSTKKRKKKVRVVWDVDAWDANARWPTDEALVKEQVDKDLKGRRTRRREGGDAPCSVSTRERTDEGKQKAKGDEEDEDLDLHLGGLDDVSDEDRDTLEESDTDETQGDEATSRNGRGDAGGSRKADALASPSLTPAFVLNLSLSLLHSLPPRRGLPGSGEGTSDAVGLLGSPSVFSPSCLASHAARGTEETDARVRTNGGTTPLALVLSCLDVAHLYQTLLLPPGGFSLDWSRLLVAPARPLAAPFERDQGGRGSASLTGVPFPSVWALEPRAGAAVVALGLQAVGGDGLEGLRFGFLAGSTMSKQTMIFLTQLLFQWRLLALKEESEQLAHEHRAGSRLRSLRESSLSEELLGLLFRCLSLSPLFETDTINELAIWVAALAPRQPETASSDGAFCFRCAASYFLAIVKFALEKPLLLSQKPLTSSSLGPHPVDGQSSPSSRTSASPSSRAEETAGATPGVSLFVRALLAHLSLAPECNRGKPLYVDVHGPSLSLFLSPDAPSLAHADSCPAAAPSTAKRDTAFCVDSIGAWVSRGLLALLALRPCLLESVRSLLDRQKPWRVVGAALGLGKDAAKRGDEPPGEEKHTQEQSKKRTREESVRRDEKGGSKKAAEHLGDAEAERERGGESAEEENAIGALRKAAARHPLYPRMNDWRRRLSRVLREASRLARHEQETVEKYGVLDLQGSRGFVLAEPDSGERDIVLEEASRFLPSERLLFALADLDDSLGLGTSEAANGIQKDGEGGSETAWSSASTGLSLEFVLLQIHPSRALVGVSPGDSERRKSGHFRLNLESLPAFSHARSCPRSPLLPPVGRPLSLSPAAAAAARSNVGCLLRLWASCLRHQTTWLSLAPAETQRERPTRKRVASLLEKLLETFHLIQRLSARAARNSFPPCLSEGMQPFPVASRALQERGSFSRLCAPCGTSDGRCEDLGLPDADSSWISSEPGLTFSSPLARPLPAEICDCSVFACLLNSAGSQGISGLSLERRGERELREAGLRAETRRAFSVEEDASGRKDREHLRAAKKKKKRETVDRAKGEEGERTALRIALLSCTYITTVLIKAAAGACRSENSGWGQACFLPLQKRDSSGFLAVARRLIPLLLTQVAIPLSRLAALEQRRESLGSRVARASSGPERRQTGDACAPEPREASSALQVHARETLKRICAAAAVWGLKHETLLAPAVCFLHGGDSALESGASAQDFTAGARTESSKKRGGRGVFSAQEEDETEQDSRHNAEGERRRGTGAIYVSGPGARFPASLEGSWPLDLIEMYMETFCYGTASVGSLQPFREISTEEKTLPSSFFLPSSLSRPLDTAEIRLLLVLLQRVSEPGGASDSEEKSCGLPRAVTDSCTDTREELRHRARVAKLLVRLLDALRKSRFRGAGGSLPAVETPEQDEGQREEAREENNNFGEKTRRATLRTFDTLQVVYERQLVQQCLLPAFWLLPASSLSSSLSAASHCGVCTPETADPGLWRVVHPALGRLFHNRFAESPLFRVAVGLELGSGSFATLSDSTASPLLSPASLLSHAEASIFRRHEGGGCRGCLLPAWRFVLELLQLTEDTRCLPPLFPARRRLIKRLLACTGLADGGEAGFKKAKKEEKGQQTGPGDDAKREKKIKQAATNWGESMLRTVLRACDLSPSQGVEAFEKSSSSDVGSPESDAEPRFSPATERKLLNAALDFYEGREGDYGLECTDRFADTPEATEISRSAFSSLCRSRRQSAESEEADGEEAAEPDEGKKTREARSDVSEDSNETFALLQRAVAAIQKGLTSFANRSSVPLHEKLFLDEETPQGCGRIADLADGGWGHGEEEEARRTRIALQRSAALWMAVGLYEASRRFSQEAGTCGAEGGTSGDSTEETTCEKKAGNEGASSSRACLRRFLVDAFAGLCCRLAVDVFSIKHAETVARSLLSSTPSRWRSTPALPLADVGLSAPLSDASAHLLERLENLQELLVHEWPVGTESENQAATSRHRLGEETEPCVVDFLAQLQLAVSLWQLLRRLPVSEDTAKSSRDPHSSSPSSALSSSVSASPFSSALRRKADRYMLRLARSFCRRPGGTKKLDEVATLLASALGSVVSCKAGEKECVDPKKLLASSRSRAALYARAWCLTYLPVWRAGLVAAAALPVKASEALTGEKEETAEGDEQTLRRKRVWTLAEEMLHSDALWQLAAGLRFLCLAACKDGVRQELRGAEERSCGTTTREGEDGDASKDKKEGPGAKGEGGGEDELDSGRGGRGREANLEASGDALQAALLPLIRCLGQELLPTYYAASSEKKREAERGENAHGTSGEENGSAWEDVDADGDYGYEDGADEYENNSRKGYGRSGKSIFFDDEEEEAREADHGKRGAARRAGETSTERHLSLLIDILPKELYALFASFYGASASSADLCLRDIFTADRAEVREVYIHSSFAFTAQRAGEGLASEAGSLAGLLPVTDALAWMARLPEPRERHGNVELNKRAGDDEGEDALLLLLSFLRHAEEEKGLRYDGKDERAPKRRKEWRRKETKGSLAHAWTLDSFQAFVTECEEAAPSSSLTSVLVAALGTPESTSLDWLGLNPNRMQKTLDAFPFSASLPRPLDSGLKFADRGNDAWGRPAESGAQADGLCSAEVAVPQTGRATSSGVLCALPATPLDVTGSSGGCTYTSEPAARESRWGQDALFGFLSRTQTASEAIHQSTCRSSFALATWFGDTSFSSFAPPACEEDERENNEARLETLGVSTTGYDIAYLVPFLTGRLVAACTALLYQLRDPREVKTHGTTSGDALVDAEPAEAAALQLGRDSTLPCLAVLARRACGTAYRWLQSQREKAELQQTGASERRRRRKRRRLADAEEDDGDLGYAEEEEAESAGASVSASTEEETDTWLLTTFDLEELERATDRVWPFLNAARQLQTRQRMRHNQINRLKEEAGGELDGEEVEPEEVDGDDGRWLAVEELHHEDQAEAALARWAEERHHIDQQGAWLRKFASGGGLQILFMALSATDADVRSAAFHGLAVFSHLLRLSADLTLLHAFAEKHFLMSKVAALSASLAAAAREGAGTAPGGEGSTNPQKSSLLSAKKRKFVRQLEQHKSVFAFRELRQLQLLLAAVCSSVEPPTGAERAETGDTRVEEETSSGMARARRRRRRAELDDEEAETQEEVEGWTEAESPSTKQETATGNDAVVCPEVCLISRIE